MIWRKKNKPTWWKLLSIKKKKKIVEMEYSSLRVEQMQRASPWGVEVPWRLCTWMSIYRWIWSIIWLWMLLFCKERLFVQNLCLSEQWFLDCWAQKEKIKNINHMYVQSHLWLYIRIHHMCAHHIYYKPCPKAYRDVYAWKILCITLSMEMLRNPFASSLN